MEIWRDIKNYEGKYMISSYGRVLSLSREVSCRNRYTRTIKERILKENIGTNGYYYVVFDKTKYIHRLVAETFIEKIDETFEVDHIDGNKLNNNVCNLRWISHFENSSIANKGVFRKKSNAMEFNPKAKKVYCYSVDGKLVRTYNCAKKIAIEFGIKYPTLKSRLQKEKLYINNLKYTYNEVIS